MSEVEFWASTCAKVTAMYNIKVNVWDRTRDYFPSLCASIGINMHTKEGAEPITPDQILSHRYRKDPDVTVTDHDPDHGALGDWRSMRSSIKGIKDV
jgi:hypothetical protein